MQYQVLNTSFVYSFFFSQAVIVYHFEVLQELKFSVYDVDSESPSLESHDFLGSCNATLGQVRLETVSI